MTQYTVCVVSCLFMDAWCVPLYAFMSRCVYMYYFVQALCVCVCLYVSVCACIIGICSCSIQGQHPQQRSTGVCLVQCSGQRRSTQPGSIIFEINKFLIGLQWGKERQLQQGRGAGQQVDDDTNRSISSIEEDFLTASEHLGDDSEDDGFRNGESCYLCQRGFVFSGCVSVLLGRISF